MQMVRTSFRTIIAGARFRTQDQLTLYDGATIERAPARGKFGPGGGNGVRKGIIRESESKDEVVLQAMQLSIIGAWLNTSNARDVVTKRLPRMGTTTAMHYLALEYHAFNPKRTIIMAQNCEASRKCGYLDFCTVTLGSGCKAKEDIKPEDCVIFVDSTRKSSFVVDLGCHGVRLGLDDSTLLPASVLMRVRHYMCAQPRCLCEFAYGSGKSINKHKDHPERGVIDRNRVECLIKDASQYKKRYCKLVGGEVEGTKKQKTPKG